MKDFRLFSIRQNLTIGSNFPGIIHLILNLAICYLAFFDGRIESLSDVRCPEIDELKESKPQKYHYMVIKWMCIVMLLATSVMLVIKIISLLTFALCPVCGYRVTKKFQRNSVPAPDTELDSQKTLSFRLALQKRKL